MVAERLKTGQGAMKPDGMVEGFWQAACTARTEKKAEATRAAPVAAPPIRNDFLRFNIGGSVIRIGYIGQVSYGLGTGGRGGTLEELGGGKGVGVGFTTVTFTVAEPSVWPFCFKASTVRLCIAPAVSATLVFTVVPGP